jgi:subtilisin family serine protease
MRKLFPCLFVGFLAAACSTSGTTDPDDGDELGDDEDQPAPEDDVLDEAAGEDALKVLQGEQPGVVVIVEYAEGADVNLVTDALAAEYGLVVTSRYHDLGGAAFIAPDQWVGEQIRLDTRVIGVTEDQLVPLSPGDRFASETDDFIAEAAASGEVDDIEAASQTPSTGWRLIGADRAPGNGSGTRVGVIDTGVAGKHPDLKAAISTDYGKDCVRRKNKTTYDFYGHGTHVSGIIAAQNNGIGVRGVAPGTKIVPIRVFDGEGFTSTSILICGVDYAARRPTKIQVVNMSLGGACGACPANPFNRAVRKMVSKGITVVVAAGNEGVDANTTEPAFIDEVITVSAYMDGNGLVSSKDRYAGFSNWGPGVDIGAPGVNIRSTVPGGTYERMSGTSMAAPFVAGAAAVVKQTRGGSPADIRAALVAAAVIDYPGRGDRHPERLLRLVGVGTAGTCGDAICGEGEDDDSCAADCGCAATACDADGPAGCSCAVDCEGEACCSDSDICPIM